jgi:hypothetical protein
VTGGSGLVGQGIRWQVRDDWFDGVCRRLHDAFALLRAVLRVRAVLWQYLHVRWRRTATRRRVRRLSSCLQKMLISETLSRPVPAFRRCFSCVFLYSRGNQSRCSTRAFAEVREHEYAHDRRVHLRERQHIKSARATMRVPLTDARILFCCAAQAHARHSPCGNGGR